MAPPARLWSCPPSTTSTGGWWGRRRRSAWRRARGGLTTPRWMPRCGEVWGGVGFQLLNSLIRCFDLLSLCFVWPVSSAPLSALLGWERWVLLQSVGRHKGAHCHPAASAASHLAAARSPAPPGTALFNCGRGSVLLLSHSLDSLLLQATWQLREALYHSLNTLSSRSWVASVNTADKTQHCGCCPVPSSWPPGSCVRRCTTVSTHCPADLG